MAGVDRRPSGDISRTVVDARLTFGRAEKFLSRLE